VKNAYHFQHVGVAAAIKDHMRSDGMAEIAGPDLIRASSEEHTSCETLEGFAQKPHIGSALAPPNLQRIGPDGVEILARLRCQGKLRGCHERAERQQLSFLGKERLHIERRSLAAFLPLREGCLKQAKAHLALLQQPQPGTNHITRRAAATGSNLTINEGGETQSKGYARNGSVRDPLP